MPLEPSKPKTIYRGTNMNPEHIAKWDRLAAYAGMNPNRFLRFVLSRLTPKDIDDLHRRQ